MAWSEWKNVGMSQIDIPFICRSGIGISNNYYGRITVPFLDFAKIEFVISNSYTYSGSYYNYIYGVKAGVKTLLKQLNGGETGTFEYTYNGTYDSIMFETSNAHSCGATGIISLIP